VTRCRAIPATSQERLLSRTLRRSPAICWYVRTQPGTQQISCETLDAARGTSSGGFAHRIGGIFSGKRRFGPERNQGPIRIICRDNLLECTQAGIDLGQSTYRRFYYRVRPKPDILQVCKGVSPGAVYAKRRSDPAAHAVLIPPVQVCEPCFQVAFLFTDHRPVHDHQHHRYRQQRP